MGMDFGADQVLVTGAAGWLGRGLLHALVNGLPDVEALKDPQPGLKIRGMELPEVDTSQAEAISDRIQMVQGDVRNPAHCRTFCEGAGGTTLFHLVGLIHPRRVRQYYEVNVDGTRNILQAAVEAGVRRVLVMSSNSPCGCNSSRERRFDEASPYHPYMNYGRSKMRMEQLVHDVQATGQIETVIIRAAWFYGPFQPPRQTLFFEMIRDGKAPIVGGGENLRSMSYIENLAQGLILAAMKPEANGQTYWIADERPYTMNEIMDTVERLLEAEFKQDCAHKRMRLPGLASKVAWLIDGMIQGLGRYHQKIHVLSEMNKTIACSVDKAKAELGYQPAVELEEGMRRSLKWCVENGLLST